MGTLAQEHDCLLLDLDGTVFRGHEPTIGAVDTLATVDARTLYVTNNASRSAAEVAGHLQELGFDAQADDVVTSAQSAARLLAGSAPAGATVLVVGTDSLAAEIVAVGLKPVRAFDENPVAVVQGHNPETGWPILAGGGTGHPGRCPVGGRQRRSHAALRTRTTARQRLDGGRTARRHRCRTSGRRQARTRR